MDNLDKITEQFLRDLEEAEQKEYQERQEKERLKAEKKKAEQEKLDLRIKENESVVSGYENLLSQVKAEPGQLTTIKEAVQHIEELINLRYNSTLNTDRELIFRLDKIRSELLELKLKTARTGHFSAVNESEEKLEDKETLKDYNKPVITRNMLVFLMNELKSNRVFISDIQDTKLAKAFSDLSGYSADQLRKALSPLRSRSIKFAEEDKSKLKSIPIKISEEIDRL